MTGFQKVSIGCLLVLIVLVGAAIVMLYRSPAEIIVEIQLVPKPSPTTADPPIVAQVREPTETPTLTPTFTPTRVLDDGETATVIPIWSPTPTERPTVRPTASAGRSAKVASGRLATTPASAATRVVYADAEASAVNLINQARQAKGVPVLARDALLDLIARARSVDMAKRGYFSHEDPAGGRLPLERLLMQYHVDFRQAGENIAYFLGPTEAGVLPPLATQKWLESPPHRQNIMDPSYNLTGFGIASAKTEEGTIWYLTQIFVQR